MLKAGTLLFERFEYICTLARGGEATILKVRDPVHGVCALKTRGFGSDSIEVFEREFKHLRGLSGQTNIVQVYECRAQVGECWILMEFIDGATFDKMLAEDLCLAVCDALDVLGQAARAVHAMHTNGLLHRDLHPGNIMVRRGVAVLVDFGTVRTADHGQEDFKSRPEIVRGAMGYIAPELRRCQPPTVQSDIWSLGKIASQVLALLERRQLSAEESALRVGLQQLIEVAQHENATYRHATAAIFADEIERLLRGESLRVITSRRQEIWRSLKTHSVALFVVSLLLAGVLGVYFKITSDAAENASLRADKAAQMGEQIFLRGVQMSRRGAWGAALSSFELARATCKQQLECDFERIEALDALNRSEEAHALLQGVLQAAVDTEAADRAKLYWLDRHRNPMRKLSRAESKALADLANANTLRPADAAYAKALIAGDIVEAIVHLRAAIGNDSQHRRANEMLVPTLILAGRFREAERAAEAFSRLYVDDPGAGVLERLCASLRRDAVPPIDSRWSERKRRMVTSCDSLVRAMRGVESLGEAFGVMIQERQSGGKADLGPILLRFAKVLMHASSEHGADETFYRVAPAAITLWNRVVLAAIAARPAPSYAVSELTDCSQVSDDGFIFFARALAHAGLPDQDKTFRDMLEAATSPSMIGGFQKAALCYVFANREMAAPDLVATATRVLGRVVVDPQLYGFASKRDHEFLSAMALPWGLERLHLVSRSSVENR